MTGLERARLAEAEVNAARKAGDIPALIEVASGAIDRLVPVADAACVDERVEILKTCKRMAYNAAADVWPGWETGVSRTADELAAGRDLATRSSSFVVQLAQGGFQQGNAIWLIGAFDLAQGDRAAAAAAFGQAAELFAETPEMRLMAEGYRAIATGGDQGRAAFESATAGLAALGDEDAMSLRDQLMTAHRVFAA